MSTDSPCDGTCEYPIRLASGETPSVFGDTPAGELASIIHDAVCTCIPPSPVMEIDDAIKAGEAAIKYLLEAGWRPPQENETVQWGTLRHDGSYDEGRDEHDAREEAACAGETVVKRTVSYGPWEVAE